MSMLRVRELCLGRLGCDKTILVTNFFDFVKEKER